jgi:hypothetical protein
VGVRVTKAGGQCFDQYLAADRLVIGDLGHSKIQSIKQHGSSHGGAVYDPLAHDRGVDRTADRNG